MEITVSKRFLRVPVKFDGTSHKFTFSENGTPVYKFDAVYTEENADAVYYADLRDYLGKTMTVTVEPECAFTPVFEDAMTPLTAEETVLRPQLHFTAERGWINDPNGLCFYGGQYHLFYQHNPYGRLWGNMHWGHAVSPDLFHWEYKEEAMFLDMDGAMFSGCAVVDHNNVSGLKEGDETPILFFYTCAGEKKSTQCLAYSTDGGKTLKKYDKNPLIDEIAPGNRDPKVIYDAKRARWLMALYFVERTYAIFTSQDLLHWDLLQRFDLPGDDECPDLYPLTADDGRTLWVYSGAHDMYFVGDFDENGLYQPIQSVGQLSYNSQSYAAQTYYYEPGKPVIRFAWNRSDIPGAPFNGSMCTPTEMTLKKHGDRYYLSALPIKSTENLVVKSDKLDDFTLTHCTHELGSKTCRISFTVKEGDLTCSLYGLEMKLDKNGLTCGESILPRLKNEPMKVDIITDTNSVEIYLNGVANTVIAHVLDEAKPTFTIHAEDPVEVQNLTVSELSL